MNCKPGDLAVMVRSFAGNEGKIVRCLRLACEGELIAIGWAMDMGPVWYIDMPLRANWGLAVPLAIDAFLRPIRDPGDDATDETLVWAGKPQREHA